MAELTAAHQHRSEVGLAQAVAAHAYGLALQDLSRRNHVADRARQVAMYLARVCLHLSLREIGQSFERDHKAVAHACRRVEEAREDPTFDRTLEWLETLVRHAAGVAI